MGIQDLPEDERKRVYWVLDWISRMAQKHGGTVHEKGGKNWDWGQALCRECYGSDWNKVIDEQNITTPSWEDIARAKKWEDGETPPWVREVGKGQGEGEGD